MRAIEEKVFERVGGTTPIKANVRIIASTKRNLLEKIAEGTFREDLYYRLDVLRMNIPPLRERLEDVPLLAEHLLARIAGRAGMPHRRRGHGSPPAARLAGQRPRTVPHAGAGLPGRRRTRHGRGADGRDGRHRRRRGNAPRRPAGDFQAAMDQTERELLDNALRAAGGNKTAAAAALGMKPSTFRDKLAKHGLG